MTSSEANLPTLAKMLFAARKRTVWLDQGTLKFVCSLNENTQVSDWIIVHEFLWRLTSNKPFNFGADTDPEMLTIFFTTAV